MATRLMLRRSHRSEPELYEPSLVFGPADRGFARLSDVSGWGGPASVMPVLAWKLPDEAAFAEGLIAVDEFRDGDTLVIRAELPGIDPDADVDLTVSDGLLCISAERHETPHGDSAYMHHEMHTGTFVRYLDLPDGTAETDITAGYKDGILEIRVPYRAGAVTRIPVSAE